MNVFNTHRQIVNDYAQYIRSFINISDPEIARKVEDSLSEGRPERNRLPDAARRREIDIIPSGTYQFRDQRARLE